MTSASPAKKVASGATLSLGEVLLERHPFGAIDPFVLTLFDAGEPVDGEGEAWGHSSDAARALIRLDEVGADRALLRLIDRGLRLIAAFDGERSTLWRRPEVGWLGLEVGGLLEYTLTRRAMGCEPAFVHLDIGALAPEVEPAALAQTLRLLWLRCALEAAGAGGAALFFDLSAAASRDEGGLLEELWGLRPEPGALLEVTSRVRQGVLDALARRTSKPLPRLLEVEGGASASESLAEKGRSAVAARLGDWPAQARPRAEAFERDPSNAGAALALLDALESAGAIGQAEAVIGRLLTASADVGEEPETWSLLLEWCVSHGQGGVPLLWRDPEAVVAILPGWSGDETNLIDALRGVFAVPRAPVWARGEGDGWRVEAVALAGRLLALDLVPAALALTRMACDVDAPVMPLVESLRAILREHYGQAFEAGVTSPADFLLPAQRGAESDDRVDLARLFHDALVGAVLESTTREAERREAIFSERVAPALAYLDASPGERRAARRDAPLRRDDEGGPGIVAVSVFLLTLIGLVVLAGWLLQRCEPI